MTTELSRLVPGTRLTEEEFKRETETRDRMIEAHLARLKQGRPWNPAKDRAEAADFKTFLEGIEALMEKKGVPHTKHSHRFAPENLWPDKNGAESLHGLAEDQAEHPAGEAQPAEEATAETTTETGQRAV